MKFVCSAKLTYGRSSFGAIPDIITKYRKMTFKLFGQNWHKLPHISSISRVCESEYCKMFALSLLSYAKSIDIFCVFFVQYVYLCRNVKQIIQNHFGCFS